MSLSNQGGGARQRTAQLRELTALANRQLEVGSVDATVAFYLHPDAIAPRLGERRRERSLDRVRGGRGRERVPERPRFLLS